MFTITLSEGKTIGKHSNSIYIPPLPLQQPPATQYYHEEAFTTLFIY